MKSSSAATRKSAETPYKFFSTPQTNETCITIPRITSSRRQYVPLDFVKPEIIITSDLVIIPDANLIHFGILTSRVHMAWMRAVCGRFGDGYRYSGSIVYNNFIWAAADDRARRRIEETAAKILEVRKRYPAATLADLYDPLTMPKDLREAHRKNDREVAKLYGFESFLDDEARIVSELFKLYEGLTK